MWVLNNKRRTENSDEIKFSEHQIINILKQTKNGRTVAEICRENSISNSTYFKWKPKYGGVKASDLKRIRELRYFEGREDRNGKMARHLQSASST